MNFFQSKSIKAGINFQQKIFTLQTRVNVKMKYLILCIIFQLLITPILSTQMIILQKLQQADKQIINLSQQISTFLQSQMTLKGKQYKCYANLPSGLLKSLPQKVHNLNLKFSYKPKQNEIVKVNIESPKKIISHYQNFDYDRILDLLHGICVQHQTKQFIYQYCHKEKVRQYDSLKTYVNQAKPNFEDISLGVYNYQLQIQKSKAESDSYLSQKSKTFQLHYDQNGQLSILMDKLVKQGYLSSSEVKSLNQNIRKLDESNRKQINKEGKNQGNVNKPQIIVNTLPMPSQIYDQKNILTVQYADHAEFQIQHEKKLIRLTTPLFATNQYYLNVAFTYVVYCQYHEITDIFQSNEKVKKRSTQTQNVYNYARAVSPYQLIFTDEDYECTRVISVNSTRFARAYGNQNHMGDIRIFQNYLYGNLQQNCTNNWAWNRQQNNENLIPQMNDYLEQGTVLLIDVTFNKTKQVKSFPVTIQQFISPRLILIDQNLGKSLGQQNQFSIGLQNQDKKTFQEQVFVSNCKIISKRPIDYQSKTTDHYIIGKNIIKVEQNEKNEKNEQNEQNQKQQQGKQMLCLCQFQKYKKYQLQMEITLGQKLFSSKNIQDQQVKQKDKESSYSYYHYYLKSTVKTMGDISFINKICQKFTCYDFKQKAIQTIKSSQTSQIQQHKKEQNKIIEITTLNKKNKKYQSLSADLGDDSIIMINILRSGMVKIFTKSIINSEEVYTYLLTQKNILKIRTYPNNTKQIIRDNPYYENSSLIIKSLRSWLSNTIYLHKGGIWRHNDRIIFPRMSFLGQKIQNIELVNGVAYIRKLNLKNLKNPKALKISMYQQLLEMFYLVKKYPVYQGQTDVKIQLEQEAINAEMKKVQQIKKSTKNQQNLQQSQYKPLNQSISLKYQYFHGDYCGAPINKNRRTNVILRCGQAWLKFINVKEPSPCIYELNIQTRLLCRQDYKKSVQKIQALIPNTQSKLTLKRSTMCFEKKSGFDETNFIYDIETKNIYDDR